MRFPRFVEPRRGAVHLLVGDAGPAGHVQNFRHRRGLRHHGLRTVLRGRARSPKGGSVAVLGVGLKGNRKETITHFGGTLKKGQIDPRARSFQPRSKVEIDSTGLGSFLILGGPMGRSWLCSGLYGQ